MLRATCETTLDGEEMRNAPTAAPPMITSSAGWNRTERFPCSIRYPPTMATTTTRTDAVVICPLLPAHREGDDVDAAVPARPSGVALEAIGRNSAYPARTALGKHPVPPRSSERTSSPARWKAPSWRRTGRSISGAVGVPLHDRPAPGLPEEGGHGARAPEATPRPARGRFEQDVLAQREDQPPVVRADGDHARRPGHLDHADRVAPDLLRPRGTRARSPR